MKKHLLLFITMLFVVGFTRAQTIKGTVKDGKGEPIIGATVVLEKTKLGATTDFSGNFEIKNVPAGAYKVKVSYVSYSTVVKDITVATGDVNLSIVLNEDKKVLEEMIVVGYGVQRKRDVTGSISKIGSKELNDLPVPSFEAAMQGKAPGVQVTVGSGISGSPSIVRIRGISSISAGGDPLYVVDGIPITQDYFLYANNGGMNNNPLASLNPDDIESIEILKDAAANAIYGSRGANGVILITTKRANKKGWNFGFQARTGISTPTNKPNMLNSQQWLQLNQEAWENDGGVGRAPLPGGLTYADAMNTNTNWVDEVIQTGVKHGYNFSAGKGGEKLNTFINLSHDDNGSFLKGNSYIRTSGRLNLDYTINKYIKIGMNSSLSRGLNNRVNAAWSGGLGAAMSTALPIYPIRNADGSYFRGGNNPVRDMSNRSWRTEELRTINGYYIDVNPIKDLIVRGQFSFDYMNIADDQWQGPEITGNTDAGNAQRNASFVLNYNYFLTATYLKTFKKHHNFSYMLGNEFQRANTQGRNFYSSDVPGLYSRISDNYINNATKLTNPGTNWAFLSYFGRVNYNYKQKYFAQLVYRMDASSRFGANYRWASFPSISGAWVLTEEEFLKGNKTLTFLKLRAGWGLSGNANIPDDARFGTYSQTANNITYNGLPVLFAIKLPNENLRWETSNNLDLGLEIGLWNDRITFEGSYYYKKTSDVLMQLSIPASNGFPDYWNNVGGILNQGVEAIIKTQNIVTKNFVWSTNFNIARNFNEITSIGVYSEDAVSGGTNDTRVVVGHAVGTNYLIRFSRVDPTNGLPIYLDKTGNETYVYDNANRTAVGKILPDAIGGLTNNFHYQQWDISTLIVFSIGSNIYESSQKRQSSLITDWNMDERVFDRWQKPGDNATYPRLTRDYRTYGLPDEWSNTTLWLKDGSYARLRNVTVSYTVPNSMVKKVKLNSVRLAFIATNIFTLTNYDGIDPEIGRDSEGAGNGALNTSRNMGSQNITYLTTPQERSYSFQLNLTF